MSLRFSFLPYHYRAETRLKNRPHFIPSRAVWIGATSALVMAGAVAVLMWPALPLHSNTPASAVKGASLSSKPDSTTDNHAQSPSAPQPINPSGKASIPASLLPITANTPQSPTGVSTQNNVTINGQSIPLPANGSIQRALTNQDGSTTDVKINNQSTSSPTPSLGATASNAITNLNVSADTRGASASSISLNSDLTITSPSIK